MQLIEVGRMKGSHGLLGAIYVELHAGVAEWLTSAQRIYFCKNSVGIGDFVVSSAKPFKRGLLVNLEGFQSLDQTEPLRGSVVCIDKHCLNAPKGEKPYLFEFIGFTVSDLTGQSLGAVVDISSNGAQDLLVLQRLAPPQGVDGKPESTPTEERFSSVKEAENSKPTKVMIPLVPAFLREVDWQLRVIVMDLPEGLLELGFED